MNEDLVAIEPTNPAWVVIIGVDMVSLVNCVEEGTVEVQSYYFGNIVSLRWLSCCQI